MKNWYIVQKGRLCSMKLQSEDLFKLYPDQRRPTRALAEDVDNMLSVNGNPTLVAQVLHKQGHAVHVKDIHNRKQKLAECGAALPDWLRGTLSAPDVQELWNFRSHVLSLPGAKVRGNESIACFSQTHRNSRLYLYRQTDSATSSQNTAKWCSLMLQGLPLCPKYQFFITL